MTSLRVLDNQSSKLATISPLHPGVSFPSAAPLPAARGVLSDYVLSCFAGTPHTMGAAPSVVGVDALTDDDFHLALYACYEAHYRDVVDPVWEWNPTLLSFRAQLESAFVQRLRDVVPTGAHRSSDVRTALENTIASGGGPSLSTYMAELGSLRQMREFCVHRSAYQLKEADPHTFGIPRLRGEAKAAMVHIQFDEYGSGNAPDMHSTLFANTMSALGLDPTYGRYVGSIPGVTLATVNLVSMFGLHRRWRGALVGHLAVFEMTSVEPMSRYARALERLGVDPAGRKFYDVHVEADQEHALIARDRLVAGLVSDEPSLRADVLFGAGAVLLLEQRFTRHLLTSWSRGASSLLTPLS